MTRFSSLPPQGSEARRVLRDTFGRSLGRRPSIIMHRPGGLELPDETALAFFQGVTIEYANTVERLRRSNGVPLGSPASVDPDAILAGGWGRAVWGRVTIPFDAARAAMATPAPNLAPPASFLSTRFGMTVMRCAGADWAEPAVEAFDLVASGREAIEAVGCTTPKWVAARLWDRRGAGPCEPAARLAWWHQRWNLLGCPALAPFETWEEADASSFMEASLAVLGLAELLGWEAFRGWCGASVAAAYGRSDRFAPSHVPPVPQWLAARWLWLDDGRLERPLHWTLEASGAVLSLVGPLVEQIVATDYGPGPNPFAARLITLAIDRPELLCTLVDVAQRIPEVLVELAVDARTAPLACLLVSEYRQQPDSWDHEASSARVARGKRDALVDALGMMGALQGRGDVDAGEFATLLVWLRRTARHHLAARRAGAGEALSLLLQELGGWSRDSALAIATCILAGLVPADGDMTPLAACLDLIDGHDLVPDMPAETLVEAYLTTLEADHLNAVAGGFSAGGAARLCALAAASRQELKVAFFGAARTRARHLVSADPDANPYVLADEVARATRLHLRVLCRAVTGSEVPSADVSRALEAAMLVAATPGIGKQPLAALSPRHESDRLMPDLDGPIADEVGRALRKLQGGHGDRLLSTALLSDEPYFVARLRSSAPGTMRSRIDSRLDELGPSECAGALTLTETQARIEALLAAGRADLAASFIDDERLLETLGPVPERGLVRLRAECRVLLAQRHWAEIDRLTASTAGNVMERQDGADVVDFYKALAALQRPGGDVVWAEAILTRLRGGHPGVTAYRVNLFAATVNRILGERPFGPLQGTAAASARRALVESAPSDTAAPTVEAGGSVTATNRALLAIALGDVREAQTILAPWRTTPPDATVEALAAAALAREGRRDQALLVLADVEGELGPLEVLRSVKEYVQTGSTTGGARIAMTAETATFADMAVAQLRFANLDATSQARVRHEGPDPLLELVLRLGRAAGARVAALRPVLRKLGADTREDDVTAVFGQMLDAAVNGLNWSVAEQSRGGLTAAGGPGERDLVVMKDGAVIAVVEAVACRLPLTHAWMRDDLASHLVKVLGYANCRIFLHVTYAFASSARDILGHLAQVAEGCVPPDFRFVATESLPTGDSGPPGIAARYETGDRDVALVCLVVDMRLEAQQAAAKAGAGLNPRTKIRHKG